MKITPKKFDAILNRYKRLKELSVEFANIKKGLGSAGYGKYYSHQVRICEDGSIDTLVNNSCNCHPEYEWEQIATKEEFLEYLKEWDL